MRMNNLLTLAVISLSLFSCGAPSFPKQPDVKDHYMVNVTCVDKDCTQTTVTCVKYHIDTLYPYKISNGKTMPMRDCRTVGGYTAKDFQKILNWSDDVNSWYEDNKECFK